LLECISEFSKEGEKEEKNNREWIILKYITSCRNKTQQNALKQYEVGEKDKEE
jgi:hypothetical protein